MFMINYFYWQKTKKINISIYKLYQVIALNEAFYKLLDQFASTYQVIVLYWSFYKLFDKSVPIRQVGVRMQFTPMNIYHKTIMHILFKKQLNHAFGP
jgi:hypothetical protein